MNKVDIPLHHRSIQQRSVSVKGIKTWLERVLKVFFSSLQGLKVIKRVSDMVNTYNLYNSYYYSHLYLLYFVLYYPLWMEFRTIK